MADTSMSRRRAALALAGGVAAAMAPWPLRALAKPQEYPGRPLTMIMPFPPGGATDVQMRALAHALSKEMGQQVVVTNQPGVAGTMGPAAMARTAAADGYTFSVVPATLFRLPHLQKVNFDPLSDFTYVICLTGYTNGLVVRADAPWKTLKDLLADAKARPGQISYGSTGVGSGGHVAMERLARAAGVKFNFVPYKGMAEETTALLGGHLDIISDPGWSALVDGGRARLLATLGSERLARRKDVPTLKELGYDITVHSPVGIVAPKNLDPAVLKSLHDALRRAMRDADYQRMLADYDQVDMYMSSAEYRQYAIDQFAREKVFLDQIGVKLQ